ncbi:MAG: hypothetical protein ABH864_07395 [archaeon]
MNCKATLKANVIYILLTIAFIVLLGAYVWDQPNGASVWAEYYSKEIARMINVAEPGQTITLDVHKATEVAYNNYFRDQNKIFEFHNERNEVCVKLTTYRKTCYTYFNDVDIVEYKIIPGRPINLLEFTVQEKPTTEENDE